MLSRVATKGSIGTVPLSLLRGVRRSNNNVTLVLRHRTAGPFVVFVILALQDELCLLGKVQRRSTSSAFVPALCARHSVCPQGESLDPAAAAHQQFAAKFAVL